MSVPEFLQTAANFSSLSRKSIVLLFAYYLRKYQGLTQFSATDLRRCFQDAMLRLPSDLAKILKALSRGPSSPLLKGGTNNYSMSLGGLREVESYLTASSQRPAATQNFLDSALPYLEKLISKINQDNERRFLAEAVACLEVDRIQQSLREPNGPVW